MDSLSSNNNSFRDHGFYFQEQGCSGNIYRCFVYWSRSVHIYNDIDTLVPKINPKKLLYR